MCTYAAKTVAIRKSIGHLHILDGRSDPKHPLLEEIKCRGLDLDEGMVLVFGGQFYHGADALHLMGILGESKLNALLFRNRTLARFAYPILRFGRNMLLRLRGVEKIRNLQEEPIFKPTFGEEWQNLPPVMKTHYALRAGMGDSITVKGHLDVKVAPWLKFLNRVSGLLISQGGENIPVTVRFTSPPGSRDFHFERSFHFPSGVQHFKSRMRHLGEGKFVEIMRFGFAWALHYQWENDRVILAHRGYAFNFFGWFIPIPLGLLLGRGYAEEWALSDDEFAMMTYARHSIFGQTFGYEGRFKVTDISCPIPS